MLSKGLRGKGAVVAVIAAGGLALSAVTGVGVALAAPGELDPTFSGDGKATVNFGSDDAWSNYADVAVTPSGKIVMAGTTEAVVNTNDHERGFGLAQLLPDGTLDPSFGGGDGLAVKELGWRATAEAMAVQPDGKIVVVGYDSQDSPSGLPVFFDVLRFNADGSPDTTFGSGGVKSSLFTSSSVKEAMGVTITPDGRIVVVGMAGADTNPNNLNTAIAVLEPDGTPDPSFSGDGLLTTTSSGPDAGYDVAVQSDGKIVVAGERSSTMTVRRYRPDGTVDPLFGNNGVAEAEFPNGDSAAYGLALQPDGGIVLAGSAGTDNGDFAVARITSSGALDPAFSNDGEIDLDLGSTYDTARDVEIQADGKLIIGGDGGGDQRNLVALRLNPTGAIDTTFGGGLIPLSFASTTQYGGHVAIQPDGGVLVSGVTYNNDDFAVARLQGDSAPATPPGGGVDQPPASTDAAPPETTITKFPKDHITKSKAKYRFVSTEPHSTFECALDSKNFVPCGDGKVKYKHVDFGKHHFLVRATDAAGNTDQSPARDKFERKR